MPSDAFHAVPFGLHVLPRRKKAMTFAGVLLAMFLGSLDQTIIGTGSAVYSLSSIIGPTLGGYITDTLSWNWFFFINIPLCFTIITLFALYFPDVRPKRETHRIDWAGMTTLALARNHQALVSAEQRQLLRGLFPELGPQATALFDATIESLRQALQAALSQVFLVALVVVAGACLINFWLEEIPLRGHPLR